MSQQRRLRVDGLTIDDCRRMLGLPPLPKATERQCLHCGERFKSVGPHHRHCSLCRRQIHGLTSED